MVQWLPIAVAVLIGLPMGSFLNVCIARLPRSESVVSPRSHCRHCSRTLAAFENIPVLSWLWLRGKCRSCGKRISWQYPAVELTAAAWFGWAFTAPARLFAGPAGLTDAALLSLVHAVATAAMGFLLLGLMLMDWQTGLLPNEFTLGGLVLGLFFTASESFFVPPVAFKTFFTPEEVFILHRALAAVFGFLLLASIGKLYQAVRGRPGMGLGDAKLLAMIASFLGPQLTVLALFLGVALAGTTGIFLLLARRADGTTKLPFGSFLCVGGLTAAVTGQRLLDWYMSLFR